MRRSVFLLTTAICVLYPATYASAQTRSVTDDPGDRIDFHHQVLPILVKHCVKCHAGRRSEGDLRIESRRHLLAGGASGPAVVEGKSNESLLIERVTDTDPEQRMPAEAEPLAAEEIQILRRWIDEGLAWEEQFRLATSNYEPPLHPRRPNLPPSVDSRENPLDRILDQYLRVKEQPRPDSIDDARFMRRVYLDLLGLLPTPDELASFVQDGAEDKRERLVDNVLANNEAYAIHWLTFWNDLLRNAYSGTGFIDGGRRQITGWLYESLYDNKPYDQFVRELIDPTPASEGFIRGIKWRGDVNASQKRELQFAQSTTQSLLGINMKCASCHDSFIDRWTLEETYNLAAVFAEGPLELHRCDKPIGKMATPAWIFPELGQIDPQAPQPARLRQLAALLLHPQNGRLSRTIVNRIWHRLMGRGIVHPVDAMQTRPWSEDLLDHLAVSLADDQYDLKSVMRLVVTSNAYQSQAVVLDEEPSADTYVYRGPLAKRMTAEQFVDVIWSVTGTWPEPDAAAFKGDGRSQGGQLLAVLEAEVGSVAAENNDARAKEARERWGDRPVRAALTKLDLLQRSLGRPIREQVVTMRPVQLTTLEAVTLANGPSLADMLRRGAEKILEQHAGTADELSVWLFRSILTRDPTSDESELARAMLGEELSVEKVEDLLWSLLMLPETQIIR